MVERIGCLTEEVKTFGLRIPGYRAAEVQVDLTEELFETVQILEDRTRLFLRVGRWSKKKKTADQKWENNSVQNGKHRACCCSRIVDRFKLERKFVLHIVTEDSSRTSPSPARLRSDDAHTQNTGNNQATSSRLRDLPDWLEEFTEDLEDTEVQAPANTSQDSDSERLLKCYRGSTVFTLTSRKTEIGKSACEQKRKGLLARLYLEQKSLVT